jgi:hypothetical protein
MAGQLLAAGIGALTHLALVHCAVHTPLVVLQVLALLERLAAGVTLILVGK